MQISVKATRFITIAPNVYEEVEMCISDFVARETDHRPALAAMHDEISAALDTIEADAAGQGSAGKYDFSTLAHLSPAEREAAIREQLGDDWQWQQQEAARVASEIAQAEP